MQIQMTLLIADADSCSLQPRGGSIADKSYIGACTRCCKEQSFSRQRCRSSSTMGFSGLASYFAHVLQDGEGRNNRRGVVCKLSLTRACAHAQNRDVIISLEPPCNYVKLSNLLYRHHCVALLLGSASTVAPSASVHSTQAL